MTDCPGEPGFECSNTPGPKNLCRRCYQRVYMRRYSKNNTELQAKRRRYREKNKTKLLESRRRYYEENKVEIRKQQRSYYHENREAILDYQRRYYQDNRDQLTEKARRWREKNGDRHRANLRLWREANPEKKAEYQRQRRARKQNALHVPFTDAELAARLSMFGDRCVYCGGPFEEVDHLIPLVRGGPHCLSNLRPACHACNLAKGSKTPSEWADQSASTSHQEASHFEHVNAIANGSGGELYA